MATGESARKRAQQAREYAAELRRRSQEAYEVAGRYEAAAEAERKVAAALIALTAHGWRLLVDRRWPGTRSANVDMILVGPGGVFVIDVKCWNSAPSVVDGQLLAGRHPRDSEVDKLLAMTRTAEEHVASLGMAPIAVRPVLAFAGHSLDTHLGRVRLLGERELPLALLAEPERLRQPTIRAVADHVAEAFPAYEAPALSTRPAMPSAAATEPATRPLFDLDEVVQALLNSARSAPIEQWMTFLHPDQLALAKRQWNGPARIGGPTGTGKTVVGLHRAAYLAERSTGQILYVTYVKNLPRVQEQLFQRLSPATVGWVEFTSLHTWAQAFLAERGMEASLNREKADDAFSRAWVRAGKESVLVDVEPNPNYWRQEIDYVIKGRGLASFEEYRTVPRHGRRTALQPVHREAAWRLYEKYEQLRSERGVFDFNDLLLAALEEVQRRPIDPPYAAVIVDEVQDLTLIGVKLLHTLIGDARNGLLLIGDGQQAVYPGGFRLSDAGIAVSGRGGMLRTNYRNAAQIIDTALAMVSDDPFDDLDEVSPDGRREMDLTYHDGQVIAMEADDDAEHDHLLIETLRGMAGDGGLSDAAVLCATRRQIEHYYRILTQAGIPVLRLENYDGQPVDEVKLGTYRRAKGLEFKYVFLPRYDAATRIIKSDSPADQEHAEILRRQLFVAMTRARDLLWLGSVANGA